MWTSSFVVPSTICFNLVHKHFLCIVSVQVSKNLKDLHGPALAVVLDRLKPSGASQGGYVLNLPALFFPFSLCSLMLIYFFTQIHLNQQKQFQAVPLLEAA